MRQRFINPLVTAMLIIIAIPTSAQEVVFKKCHTLCMNHGEKILHHLPNMPLCSALCLRDCTDGERGCIEECQEIEKSSKPDPLPFFARNCADDCKHVCKRSGQN